LASNNVKVTEERGIVLLASLDQISFRPDGHLEADAQPVEPDECKSNSKTK
jgi:hypothetical protein